MGVDKLQYSPIFQAMVAGFDPIIILNTYLKIKIQI